MTERSSIDVDYHRAPSWMARLLVCATFPLIWVGGLVTTYDAGMAVPDWPSTYGYNLFLYPWQTWLAGPWDLFIEHGHRLLGALVGLIAIVLVLAVWRWDDRRWVRVLAVISLLMVVLQGVLGGQRVLLDDRRIAQIHGIVGPAFFALSVLLAVVTSRWWRVEPRGNRQATSRWLAAMAWMTLALAAVQLVLGSELRHGINYLATGVFRAAVFFHIIVACLLAVQIVALFVRVLRESTDSRLRRPAMALVLLVLVQIGLGCGSWVVKYGWPSIVQRRLGLPVYVIQAESLIQSMVVTAHVAVGALVLAVSGMLALRIWRSAHWEGHASRTDAFMTPEVKMGAVS